MKTFKLLAFVTIVSASACKDKNELPNPQAATLAEEIENTFLGISSIVKTMTATVLADMVLKGENLLEVTKGIEVIEGMQKY